MTKQNLSGARRSHMSNFFKISGSFASIDDGQQDLYSDYQDWYWYSDFTEESLQGTSELCRSSGHGPRSSDTGPPEPPKWDKLNTVKDIQMAISNMDSFQADHQECARYHAARGINRQPAVRWNDLATSCDNYWYLLSN